MGELLTSQRVARSKGTTITCRKLFESLPVRHQEFKKNGKKNFNECLNMIHSYCLSKPKVRFVLSNILRGQKTIHAQSNGSGNLLEVFSSIFGASLASTGFQVSKTVEQDNIHFTIQGLMAKYVE